MLMNLQKGPTTQKMGLLPLARDEGVSLAACWRRWCTA